MKFMFLAGNTESIDELLSDNDNYDVVYRAKYIPLVIIESDYALEYLRCMHPGYNIEEDYRVEKADDK